MKHTRLLLAVIALLVAGSPMLVQGAQNALQHVFTHPTSLPSQASDNARKALAARGTHGHEGNETGEHEDDNESATGAAHEHEANETEHESTSADVENIHDVEPSENVTVIHCITNGQVQVNVDLHVTPGTVPNPGHTVTPLDSSQVIAVLDSC